MDVSLNVAAIVFEDKIEFYRVTQGEKIRELKIDDLPTQKELTGSESGDGESTSDDSDLDCDKSPSNLPSSAEKEYFHSIHLWEEEKLHITTSRGLYTWDCNYE